MNRSYARPTAETTAWASGRETHPAVAAAIHAIADHRRSPEAIWEAPTHTEFDHVKMAVEEYITQGDFPAEDDGRYEWGQEAIVLTTGAAGEAALCAEFEAWAAANNYPKGDAMEALMSEDLTAEQRTFLTGFVARWETMEKGER